MPRQIDYAALFLHLPSPYMVLDKDLRFIEANDMYCRATSKKRDDLIGQYVFDAFPESKDRRELFEDAYRRALSGEVNSLIRTRFRISKDPEEGEGLRDVWWTCHHMPVYNKEGDIIGVVQKAQDITYEVEAEKLRDDVIREFNHRIKNSLAKVVAIARRTMSDTVDRESFLNDFDARISAMARTQDMLTRSDWKPVPLHNLITEELAPYQVHHGDRIVLNGDDIAVDGRIAQALSMAFHELVTNAAKYGALRSNDGTLNICWKADPEQQTLVIEWIEQGTMPANASKVRGFGTSILEQITPREINGQVERHFGENSVSCTFTLPLSPTSKIQGK